MNTPIFQRIYRVAVPCLVRLTASLAWLGLVIPSQATTVVPPAFAELVNESDCIVRAVVKAVTVEERLAPSGSVLIFSRVELEVKQTVAGKAPVPLVLDVLGGKTGDRELSIAGAPKFIVGEESIFFVQGNGRQIYPLVRMMHGLYRIHRETARNREYIARSNGEPLQEISEVSRPIHGEYDKLERSRQEALAISPDEFVLKIRATVTKANLREH